MTTKQPSGRDVINIIYILLAILAILLIITRFLPYDVQFYSLLFSGGIIFVIFAMIFSLQEKL